ncbi:MAG: NAD-dependent DNA ligase LigA [Lachnospiraceae bacterium]|nr:NAD-dependent DNA ligase LigA [Lachnospiraceae bacterium]
MEEAKKMERMQELHRILKEAARAYYQENAEIMSNYEYDALYDELVELEKETGIVLADSPTIKVGYEIVSELPKEAHAAPMLSLDKTKDRESLAGWLQGREGVLSWKLDGLTNVLTYENGALVKGITRGNGEIGEIITNNVKVYKNVPLSIPYKGTLTVRGEAIITYSEFERINGEIAEAEAKYKNPRNLCSGTVRQLNNEITAQRNVLFYAYTLVSVGDELSFATRTEQMEFLKKQGFTCVEHFLVAPETVVEYVNKMEEKLPMNDFPSDGLVLTFNEIAYAKSLGRTAKFPRDSIAFKWADEIAETELLEIEWSASRTGLINPVAVFTPVELEGTTVSRASIHNVSIMESLALGIGDTLQVYKANMIIPQIAANLTGSGTAVPPDVCPVCGEKTSLRVENDVKSLYCLNEECPAKRVKSIAHFVTRDAMNIDGLSEATIEKLLNEKIITKAADLFRLTAHKEAITGMEGFGEKSYANLLASVEAARTVTPARFLYALGVPNIGVSTAKVICRAFDEDIERVMNATVEELVTVEGIGAVIAEAFADYFQKEKNRADAEELLSFLTLERPVAAMESAIAGKTFVITGKVFQFAGRSELKSYIEERGGKVTGSVTAKTDYLINNDAASQSSKNKTARELNVPVITEEEFLQMAGGKEA